MSGSRRRPTVAVVGLGLIGGSLARALSRAGYAVIGVDRPEVARRARAARAVARTAASPEEAAEFRDGPSGFQNVLSNLFETVGLLTFFTGGEKETRAWTLRQGSTALDAAATASREARRPGQRIHDRPRNRPAEDAPKPDRSVPAIG